MKKITLCIFITLILFSCKNRIAKPDKLLSKEEMRDVLIEIGLSKSIQPEAMDSLLQKTTFKENKRIALIMSIKKINIVDFKNSHTYYCEQPEKYQEIMKMIDDSLTSQLKKLKSIEATKKPTIEKPKTLNDKEKKDSIMRPIQKTLDSIRKINRKHKL